MKFLAENISHLPNLKQFELSLSNNSLGENSENMLYLADLMKLLPNNLKYFKLNLSENRLDLDVENLKYLSEGMK